MLHQRRNLHRNRTQYTKHTCGAILPPQFVTHTSRPSVRTALSSVRTRPIWFANPFRPSPYALPVCKDRTRTVLTFPHSRRIHPYKRNRRSHNHLHHPTQRTNDIAHSSSFSQNKGTTPPTSFANNIILYHTRLQENNSRKS